MLVGLGCNVHHADHEGNTPWHSAAQSLSIEVLQKLLEYGCSVDSVNNLQCTALHYASRTGKGLLPSGSYKSYNLSLFAVHPPSGSLRLLPAT